VRPLCARLLEPTLPEKEGVVSREKLYDIQGRSRARLLELARQYGIENPPVPSTGCALTEPEFAKKVKDIFQYVGNYERWHFEILKIGRHFRLDPETKMIMGRDSAENEYLEYLHPKGTVLLAPVNFAGPSALLIGSSAPDRLEQAAGMILGYTKHPPSEMPQVQWEIEGSSGVLEVHSALDESHLLALRIT
jgi:hypothetical protein